MDLKIEYLDINDLKPYGRNAKKHPKEQVQRIVNSIKEFGMCDPIGIWGKDNLIVEGHGRLFALKELGYTEVPVIRLDHLTEEQRKAYTLAHNKTNESEWDIELLLDELNDITEFDMSDFGFELEEESEEPKEVVEDDFDGEVPEEPKSKLGDIYQLGEHRLMCGDSTKVEDVAKLMNGVKADMVFTDPPYGMKKENDGVANDNLNYDDLLEFNKKWIPITFASLKDNGSWYCWGIDEPLMDIYSNILKPMAKENKISIQNYITWEKESGFGQLSNLMRSYAIATEKCWFVIMGVQGYNNNSDNYFEGFEPIRKYLEEEMNKCGGSKNWKKALGNSMGHHYFTKSQWVFPTEDAYKKLQNFGLEYGAFKKEHGAFKKEYEEIKKEWYSTRAYFDNTHDNMNDVWHFTRTSPTERKLTGGHATPKPIALCSRAIKSSSRENEVVLDVFGGSGSTLIACEQLNRNAYLMELEPKWVDVIINRWEQFTGEKAVLIERKENE